MLQDIPEDEERNFDARHGAGSFRSVTQELDNPLMDYARIAKKRHVSRQAAREWAIKYGKQAVSGRHRVRERVVTEAYADLFSREKFKFFYDHAMAYFSERDIEPIPYQRAGTRFDGFKKTAALLKGKKVSLMGSGLAYRGGNPARTIKRPDEESDFVFYRAGDSFFFIPWRILPKMTTIRESSQTYNRFKNTFAPLAIPPALS